MRVLIQLTLTAAVGLSVTGQNIVSVAGNATWDVFNVALDSSGNIYAADYANHMVYKVDKVGTAWVITGRSKAAGYAGDGALASTTKMNQPGSVAVGPDGSVYIA